MNKLKENHKVFLKHDILVLKSQQRFKSEARNVFSEELNKTALSANNDKVIKSINWKEIYT